MDLFRKLAGPKSKYDRSIPYTYEARRPIPQLTEIEDIYHADTVCGLVTVLDRQGIAPDEVQIYEVYEGKENLIRKGLYATDDNQWIFKPEICRSFEEEYPGHIEGGDCDFKDRDKRGTGPF